MAGIQSSRYVLIGLISILVCVVVVRAGTLSVEISNEAGQPVAARVYLTDFRDRPLFAPGTVEYNRCTRFACEFHFVPPSGRFKINLPGGEYDLTIERGKEYLPIKATVDVPRSGLVTKNFQLRRWVNMAERGWYSADMHVHARLSDAPTLMEAEDLTLALPITRWRLPGGLLQSDAGLEACLARADEGGLVEMSRNRSFPCINEELESASSALLVSSLGREPLPLLYPFAQFGHAAKARHALADSEKATALELPATAALGAVDLVGLANNHMWRSGCDLVHWGAWPTFLPHSYPFTCFGFARAGFDIYYALLQMGFPLKLSAGSAYGVHPVPFGWSRIYVHVPGKFTPALWFDALKQGRSFVTTGPMLLLHADGLEPGEQSLGEEFPLKVRIDIELLSRKPVADAEIVVNGSAQSVALKADAAQPYVHLAHTTLVLTSTSWIAARYVHPDGPTVEVAHTSPIYFWHGQEPLSPTHAQAEYLRNRVLALIAQVEAEQGNEGSATDAKVVVDTPARRQQTLRYFRQALQIYEQKLRQSLDGKSEKKFGDQAMSHPHSSGMP
jgi:hypothetical protein